MIHTLADLPFGSYAVLDELALPADDAASGADKGWEFEPSALVAFRVSSIATARLEYHGAVGELGAPLPGSAQVH